MVAGATQRVHWVVPRGSPRFAHGRMGIHFLPKASWSVHRLRRFRPPNLVGCHCLQAVPLSHGICHQLGSLFSGSVAAHTSGTGTGSPSPCFFISAWVLFSPLHGLSRFHCRARSPLLSQGIPDFPDFGQEFPDFARETCNVEPSLIGL